MKLAFVTSNIPHYRGHLYRILDRSNKVRITHYSDPQHRNGNLSLDPEDLQDFVPISNVDIGPVTWQKGAMKAVLTANVDAFVFYGSAKFISTWVAAPLARARRKPVYFWTIGWHRPESGLRNQIRLMFYRLANELLVYGDPEKKLAVKQGYPEHRIKVIYNSVTDVNDVDKSVMSVAQKERAVGAVARLTSGKNFGVLLEAARMLATRGRPVKVIFAGDGPEREKLEALAESLDVDVEFWGATHNQEDIASFYRRVSVTVIPSAAGLTTIQSLAYGVPVITDDNFRTQMPESNAVIPGVTGSKYRSGDVEGLADSIDVWIEKASVEQSQVASACRREVEARWTPEVQAEKMLEAIGAI